MTPDAVIQLLSLIVYLAAILWGGLAVIDIRRSHYQLSVKYIASALIALSVGTAVAFSVAQTYWSLTGTINEMSFAETAAWMLYDWLNGLSHLAVVLAVRAFMRWDQSPTCQATGGVCPSHRLVRREVEQDKELRTLATDINRLQSRIENLYEDRTHEC